VEQPKQLANIIVIALSSYILYFIILWFTWLHVTLLDVRFSVDSVYERVCKALHFAVMGAFASVSTTWDPFSPDDDITITALRTMTLTLMFSRVILSIQYFVVMYFGRSKPRTNLPLAIHGSVMIISASVYLGVRYNLSVVPHTRRLQRQRVKSELGLDPNLSLAINLCPFKSSHP
jgi:hypothetical protein